MDDIATAPRRPSIAAKLVRWFWIGLCTLLTLAGLLQEQGLGALMFALAAAPVIPPVAEWLTTKGFSRVWRVGAAIILFLIGTTLSGKHSEKQVADKPASEATGVSAAPSPTRSADASAQAAFVDLYRSVLAAAGPCDKAVPAMGEAASSGNAFAAYRAAQRGHDLCQAAAMTINDLDAPSGLSSEAEEATEKALDVCRNGYLSRQTAMASAMKAFDGDGRPSVVAEVEDGLKAGQAGVLLCVAGFLEAASKADINADRLK